MSTTFNKTQPSRKAVIEVTNEPGLLLANLIDEVATMQDIVRGKIKLLKQLQTELKPFNEKARQLAEMITALAEEQGLHPDQELTLDSALARVEVGRRGSERRVADLELAMKRMGKKTFLEKATIGLGICDQYLTPEQKVGVIETTRVTRSLKIAPRDNQPTLH